MDSPAPAHTSLEHTNGIHGLVGELPPVLSKDAVEKQIYWNYFITLTSKLGIIPDVNDKAGALQKAEMIIEKLFDEEAAAKQELLRAKGTILKLMEENATIKKKYSGVARDNAEIYENDSVAVEEGNAAQKKLDEIASVLPVSPTELNKKGVWKWVRSFAIPYEKQIKDLEHRLKQSQKAHEEKYKQLYPSKPWWTWLPSLGGENL